MRIKPHLLVAIDPGSTTGLCIWNTETQQIELLKEFKGHCLAVLFVNELLSTLHKGKYAFYVEDARKARKRPDLKEVNRGKAQGVGAVKSLSKDWDVLLTHFGVKFELLPPTNTKISPEQFEKMTGIKTLKTHSHKRDSALLVIGRK